MLSEKYEVIKMRLNDNPNYLEEDDTEVLNLLKSYYNTYNNNSNMLNNEPEFRIDTKNIYEIILKLFDYDGVQDELSKALENCTDEEEINDILKYKQCIENLEYILNIINVVDLNNPNIEYTKASEYLISYFKNRFMEEQDLLETMSELNNKLTDLTDKLTIINEMNNLEKIKTEIDNRVTDYKNNITN